jgi:surface protein
MFGSHNESFDEKRQLLEARDLESNAIETNASDNNKPAAAATTTTTMFARVGKTTKFVAIGALCVGSALAVSTGSSSASQKHLFRMGETAGTADGVTDDLSEQLVGNGTTYRGKQTKSITGKDCKSWVQTTITPDDHPMDGLLENYCRNPGGVQESIFCFVGGGETEACEPLGYDSKAVLTKDQEEVERLERELAQAQEEMQPNPQEPQVGEIIVTEEVPVTNGPTADEMDDTIGSREPMQFQADADGSFAETGEVVQPQSPDDERVVGNGQAYRGKQAKSRSGLECKKWVQTTTTPDDNPTEGLEENFCRNPHGAQESIWCYVGGGQSELCDPLEGSSMPEESAEPDASVVAASMEQTAANQQENSFTEILQEVEQTADALKTEAEALQTEEQKMNPPNVEANVGFDETPETKEEEKQAKKKGNFDPAVEVIEGDGTSYRGFQTFTKTGKECVAWQYTQRTAFDYPDGDLSGNFCRNPDNQKSIYCYVGNNVAELCEPLQAPKELTNANIKEAVNKCLQEAPNDGNCPHFGAKSRLGVMKDWDVSKVTNMQELFKGKTAFNGDLSEWDTSSLTTAYQMFYSCPLFNSDISNWDVSNVENFQGMFNGNAAFNADISKWNTSKAKTMQGMFKDAINFNQDISDWDTSHVENFVSQFEGTERFDQPVGKWNTGASKSDGMQGMFQRAKSFAQDVSSFTGQASNQNQGMMFSGATAFHARFKCAMPDMGPAATCKDKTAAATEQQLGQDGLQEDQALTTALVSDEDAPVTQVNEEEGDLEDSISAESEIKDLEQELEEGEDPELKVQDPEDETVIEQELEEGEDPELMVQDPEDETVIENGLTYRGKQTHSRSGVECKNWVQTTITPDDNPGQGLESNYCRNPNGMQETIFCFIGNGETEACDAKAEP